MNMQLFNNKETIKSTLVTRTAKGHLQLRFIESLF